MPESEPVFLVEEAPEGGYVARALGASIVTEADDLPTLRTQVRDAPRSVRLPRDLSGRELAQALGRLGYTITRQTGSHLRLTS